MVHVIIADGFEVHLSFQPDFILCSVFTLKLFVLNWTWSWPVALVDIIYYDYTHTHMLCSEQSRCKNKSVQFFLPPDKLRWLNYSVGWPKVIDQPLRVFARLTDFVVVIFQLRRCHSIFSCFVCIILFTQPFCLEKNKKYYIH